MGLLDLANIGIPHKEYAELAELIEKPQGMVFVTGPTGSGKSSTLFACLNRIRGKAINITTIENPIEYKINGVNQVQINEKAGVHLCRHARSIPAPGPGCYPHRRDPRRGDRRNRGAGGADRPSVLSTLHTNDSLAAITRLRDLGIPVVFISSSLLGILAQRWFACCVPNASKRADIGAKPPSGGRLCCRAFP